MKNFGHIKSQIEKIILESYLNNNFSEEIKNFKKFVLDNKIISKLYYLYDDLNSNKGLTQSLAENYINECIIIYENTVNKLRGSDIKNLKLWLKDIESENHYTNIDNLFSQDILNIESKIRSKNFIVESLKEEIAQKNEVINIPLSSMVKVANKAINNYIESLNESDRKELNNLLSKEEGELKNEFETIKKNLLEKLENIKLNSDSDIKEKIDETINKVLSEDCNRLSYLRLKNLQENI